MRKSTRRGFLTRLMSLVAITQSSAGSSQTPARLEARLVDSVEPRGTAGGAAGPQGPVRAGEFNMVGQYDIDWLLEPPLQRLLDNIAASAPAFGSVRFFHALDSGGLANTIDDDPLDGGIVWPAAGAPMNFSRTLRALETITSRGLVPFVCLNFFPKAVAGHAATPPASFESWGTLVRRFLDELAADPRFGPAIANWKFEVWNEPNETPFWRSRYDPQYFQLYRATSEAVLAAGHPVQLGGPAIVYRTGTPKSRDDMEAFLKFVSAGPDVKCDFISLHAKGSWSSREEAELRNAVDAMRETAELALATDPARFRGLQIINNEADMRVGFNIPYQARMDERFAAWLCALMVAYDGLSARFGAAGLRFLTASDNANQHLVQGSFDGRRSICTRASNSARDLLKLAVFNFYEIVRLLGDWHGRFVAGADTLFPNSELFHIITAAASHVTSVFCVYPRRSAEQPRACVIDYTLTDIPWRRVNIARFLIDATHSNAYASMLRGSGTSPTAAEIAKIRHAQELAVSAPIQSGVLVDGEIRETVTVAPYAVAAYWITPYIQDRPADPVWIEVRVEDSNVILRWRPNLEPYFYSYEVYAITAGAPAKLVSPTPLRSAMWVDTVPPPGMRSYAVQAVTASGIRSLMVESDFVVIPRF